MAEVFLFGISVLFGGALLRELGNFLFVARILRHVTNIRFDIVTPSKRLPCLLILHISGQLVQPLLILILSIFGASRRSLGTTSGRRCSLLLGNVNKWLFKSVQR